MNVKTDLPDIFLDMMLVLSTAGFLFLICEWICVQKSWVWHHVSLGLLLPLWAKMKTISPNHFILVKKKISIQTCHLNITKHGIYSKYHLNITKKHGIYSKYHLNITKHGIYLKCHLNITKHIISLVRWFKPCISKKWNVLESIHL